jgi:hypothetical protein
VARDEPAVYAIDQSVWPRSDPEASPGRGFYYHPSRHSAGQPIVAGWAYQWLAQLSFERDSWATPLDVRLVDPTEDANAIALEQIRVLGSRLPVGGAPPLFVFDAGYDSVQLTQGLAEIPATPSPKGGRPRMHGAQFACKTPGGRCWHGRGGGEQRSYT